MRKIRKTEKELIQHLLQLAESSEEMYPISEDVYEYEGGVMGSVQLMCENPAEYARDLIQVAFTDADNVSVVITLTIDANDQLLDLDFWKEDFSALIAYPKPSDVEITNGFV